MCFCNFIENNLNSEVTLENTLKFFAHFFYNKNFKPGTVARYRTAITEPLRLKYNIILEGNKDVRKFFTAMFKQRPNIPVPAPLWSLNKVLVYIDDMTGHLRLEYFSKRQLFFCSWLQAGE